MKHTPGPWEIQDGNNSAADEWSADTDDYGNYGAIVIFGGPEALTVALVVGESPSPLADNPESEANALLIAAAPDLLEALIAVVSVADRQTVEFDMARAAIAKAGGN